MALPWDAGSLKPLTVVLGAFGSGKTEVALNCAIGAARRRKPVTLVDLDTVTPAFRSRQAARALEAAGVSLVAPRGELADADLPALPAGIREALRDRRRTVIVDAGGHPSGAGPVSSLSDLVGARNGAAWIVVNPWRPETSAPGSIALMIDRLSERARIPVAGAVVNLHLPGEATAARVERGLDIVSRGAGQAGLGILFCSVRRELAGIADRWLPRDSRVLWLDLYMRAPWDADGGLLAAQAAAVSSRDAAGRFSRGG
jgi:hypothetical protein